MNAFKKQFHNLVAYSYINLQEQKVTSLEFHNDKELTRIEVEDYFAHDWGEPIEDLEFNTKLEEAKKQIKNIQP